MNDKQKNIITEIQIARDDMHHISEEVTEVYELLGEFPGVDVDRVDNIIRTCNVENVLKMIERVLREADITNIDKLDTGVAL